MNRSTRLHLLDTLRGLTLVSMIAYHGVWNLVHLYGIDGPWFTGSAGYLWQQSICWTFIVLAGYCWSLGRNHLKRGLLIFGGGLLVSLVTHLALPAARITFGILTFTGSAVLLMIPAERLLNRIPPLAGFASSGALFFLLRNVPAGTLGFEGLSIAPVPKALYRDLLTAYLGFPPRGFFSADYFPLVPWLFLFLAGWFLGRLPRPEGLLRRGRVPGLTFLGRHSLVVYLLHQPILYGLMALPFRGA